MNLDNNLPPLPRPMTNRFTDPFDVFLSAVIPLKPLSDERVGPELSPPDGLLAATEAELARWEKSSFNVGLLCGSLMGVTVLEVTTRTAQRWIDQQPLPDTVRWYTGRSRCYLFFHREGLSQPVTELRSGAQLLSNGAHVALPGSLYEDGRFVHWESSLWVAPIAPLPEWLLTAVDTPARYRSAERDSVLA